MPDFVNVVTPSGRTISVPADQAGTLPGSRLQSPEESDEAARARAEEESYSGVGEGFAAGFLGAARVATFGASDQFFTEVGGDETRERIRGFQEHRPGATAVGEVVGAIAGPGKIAGAAGKALKGASAASRVAAAGVEGAVDGGLFSLGQTVSHAALNPEDPLTVEQIASNIGLGTALGVGLGGGLGIVGEGAAAVRKKLAGKANPLLHAQGAEARELGKRYGAEMRRVDQSLDDKLWFDAQAHRANEVMVDMLQRKPGVGAATEVDDLGRALVRDADTAVDQVAGAETQIIRQRGGAAEEAFDPNATNPGKLKAKPKARLRPDEAPTQQQSDGPQLVSGPNIGVEADKVAAAEVKALRAEYKQARGKLEKVLGPELDVHFPALVRKSPAQMAKFVESVDNYMDVVGRVGKLARKDLGPGSADDFIQRAVQGLPGAESWAGGLKSLGDKQALAGALGLDVGAVQAKSAVGDALLRSYAVARAGESATAAATTAGLRASERIKSSIKDELRGAMRPAIAAAVGHVLGGPAVALMSLAGLKGSTVKRLSEGVLFALEKGAKGSRKMSVPLASETLARHRFSTEEDAKERSLARRRAEELARHVSNPSVTEQTIANNTAPIRAHNLQLGFAIEENLKKRLGYYHAMAPKAPVTASPLVRSRWEPAPGETHELAIRIRAGEDPLSILDDFAAGRLHPAAVETVETLWPALYGQMQVELAERITELREDLPYEKRLQLSTMFQVPVESTAEPEFIKTLQDQYAARNEMEQQPPKSSGGAPPASPATKGQQLEAR